MVVGFVVFNNSSFVHGLPTQCGRVQFISEWRNVMFVSFTGLHIIYSLIVVVR